MSFRNGRIGGNADVSLNLFLHSQASSIHILQASMECMVGDTQNRWFDKGCQIIGFQTGILGNQCDVSEAIILCSSRMKCCPQSLEAFKCIKVP